MCKPLERYATFAAVATFADQVHLAKCANRSRGMPLLLLWQLLLIRSTLQNVQTARDVCHFCCSGHFCRSCQTCKMCKPLERCATFAAVATFADQVHLSKCANRSSAMMLLLLWPLLLIMSTLQNVQTAREVCHFCRSGHFADQTHLVKCVNRSSGMPLLLLWPLLLFDRLSAITVCCLITLLPRGLFSPSVCLDLLTPYSSAPSVVYSLFFSAPSVVHSFFCSDPPGYKSTLHQFLSTSVHVHAQVER
jgi:hypothetical protein